MGIHGRGRRKEKGRGEEKDDDSRGGRRTSISSRSSASRWSKGRGEGAVGMLRCCFHCIVCIRVLCVCAPLVIGSVYSGPLGHLRRPRAGPPIDPIISYFSFSSFLSLFSFSFSSFLFLSLSPSFCALFSSSPLLSPLRTTEGCGRVGRT